MFAGINIQVDAGGALILSGPNGSGKSTLMRVLAGSRRPDYGTVLWDGVPIEDDLGAHARRVAYVGHLEAVKPGLTARENLAFAARTCEETSRLRSALRFERLSPRACCRRANGDGSPWDDWC